MLSASIPTTPTRPCDDSPPQPGRVRNTIRDLMGFDFKAEEEFPPDDTGYGFDKIGDVLTVSPLLLEKYIQAAETIVARAVPTVSKLMPERTYPGLGVPRAGWKRQCGSIDASTSPRRSRGRSSIEIAGDYRIGLELTVNGAAQVRSRPLLGHFQARRSTARSRNVHVAGREDVPLYV